MGIDSWIDFCTHELEVPLCTWVLPHLGVFKEVPEATESAKVDVNRALTVLDNHLLHNTFMVGHTITLADISLCCSLLDGMKLVLDEAFRKPYANLMRWFNLCVEQPEFASVIGKVVLCSGGNNKASAPKQYKQEEQPGGKKKEQEGKKAAKEQPAKNAPKEAAPKKKGKKEGKKEGGKEKAAEKAPAEAKQPAGTEDLE